MEVLLTTREVCELLRISKPSLWRYVRSGQFPKPVRISRNAHPRWRLSDIEALLEANKNASAANAGAEM